ncbi:Sec-independent protein translocase subunit TatA [Streptantibioticus ferralitis]|uniref:Sec-independent protein translocase protein TatA n=1 Tax=Streptantibioticus ferralitis TaxID=236510 RepID=A0ABT5ZA26_9ACTN|nr:Sec-independent protein translocase subunit TatA [Streptantibioticus ferralitis]MDF2260691.1 Sec-independent protein translocase subunit TatA [Streptantibioticus ferralitis]
MFRNGLEPWHIILVVLVFVLLFGSRKLPDAARGIGKSLRILKSETRALREDDADTGDSAGSSGSGSAAPGADTAAQEGKSQEALEHKPAPQSASDPSTAKDRHHTA